MDSLNSELPTNCPQESTSVNPVAIEGSITTRPADTIFGFIASEKSDSPVQFYFYMRTGIHSDGSPRYSPVKKQRSDVRVLDSFIRGESSALKL